MAPKSLRQRILLALVLLVLIYPLDFPREERRCTIHSAIDSDGFTDFIQVCRTVVITD